MPGFILDKVAEDEEASGHGSPRWCSGGLSAIRGIRREREGDELEREGKVWEASGRLRGVLGEEEEAPEALGGVHGARLATELLRAPGRKKTRGGGWAGPGKRGGLRPWA